MCHFQSFLDWYVSCLVANAVTTVKQSILVKKTKTFGSIKSLSVTKKYTIHVHEKSQSFIYLFIINYFLYFSFQN